MTFQPQAGICVPEATAVTVTPCEMTLTCCLGSSLDLEHCTSVLVARDWSILMWIRWSQMALWFSEFGGCDVPLQRRLRQQEAARTEIIDSKLVKQLRYGENSCNTV